MSRLDLAFKAVVLIALPVAAFGVGGWGLTKLSGRGDSKPSSEIACPEALQPLGQRLGYDAGAAGRYWDRVNTDVERKFLQFDLLFPFLYAGALAASLWMAWTLLGRPCSAAWVLVPVGIAALGDWTENLVQLAQLRRHGAGEPLQAGWMQLASTATSLKLFFTAHAMILLLGMLIAVFLRSGRVE